MIRCAFSCIRPGPALLALGIVLAAPVKADHPLQLLGKGPAAWDNGQIEPCTGVGLMEPAILCVRAGAADGGDGSTSTPFASINSAVAAAKAGDLIQVAAGIYEENVTLGALNDPSGKHLGLLGGFSPDFDERDAGVHASTIDGGLNAPAVQLHLVSDGQTVLDGFHITNGRGLGSSWKDGSGHGGGVYVELYGNGEVLVSHNRIEGNRTANHDSADSRGGGIHSYVQSWGGTSGSIRIEDNLVSNNLAGRGGGINLTGRQASLLRNRVEANIGHDDHGGGIYVSTTTTTLTDNVVRSNRIGETVGYGWGGGIIVAGAAAELKGNVITNNLAPSTGSGVFWDEGATGSMHNDLVFNNQCPVGDRSGAAIYIDGGPGGPSVVSIENITVADHLCPATAPTGAAIVIEDGSSAAFRNAILWGNTRDFATVFDGSYTIEFSITAEPGNGNFVEDPLFADPNADDYHLQSQAGRFKPDGWVQDPVTSPAIDAGDPASDFSLESEPNGGRINLGAYGNTPQASLSPEPETVFADRFEPNG